MALHKVVEYIEENIESSNFTLVDFLDVEGTFNNLKLESIHIALYASYISSASIARMLKNRIINSSLGEGSIRKTVSAEGHRREGLFRSKVHSPI